MIVLARLGTLLVAALAAAPTPAPGGAAPAEPPLMGLDEALAELDAHSLALQQARAASDEASAVARQAAAPLLPTLGATGSYTRNSDERQLTLPAFLPGGGAELTLQAKEQVQATGALRVPLLIPSGWWDLAAARDAARAAGASADATRLRIRATFVQAAWVAAATEEVVVASEHALEIAAEHERSSARRVAVGTSPPLDQLRAQTERVRRESDLVKARAALARARLGLGVLLGRDTPIRVALPEAVPGVPDAAPLVEQALSRRPELAAARAQSEAARAQVDAAKARLAPQLAGNVAVFASDVPYVTGEKTGWRATLDLSWALYDGGLRYGKRRQASARLAAAAASSEALRLQILQEVRDAARDVAVATERLRLAEQQRKLAGDAAASAKRSFEAGIASSLDVLDANDRLYQADVGLADARARLGISNADLARAIGEG